MSMECLWLAPFPLEVGFPAKIFEIPMGSSQTPAPNGQEPLKKSRPPNRIYNFMSSSIYTNHLVHSWSVPGIINPQSYQKFRNFYGGNQQTPTPTMPNPLKKNRPHSIIYSLACSLICPNPRYHSWSVWATVPFLVPPKAQNFEISMGETNKPLHQLCQNLLKKIAHLIEYRV
jgi:hypothetical protein